MTPSIYNSKRWRHIRRLVLLRDLFCCVKCGTNVSRAKQARVDHIKPVETHPELAFELSNLRTLCPSCDNQSHREKGRRVRTGEREERIQIRGHDAAGAPLDPEHPWNRK